MYYIRNIFSLRVITVFALVALFMASVTITPGEARRQNGSTVKCPCQFYSTFLFLNHLISSVGGKPDYCVMDVEGSGTALSDIKGDSSGCHVEMFNYIQPSNNYCQWVYNCDQLMQGQWAVVDLDSETAEACAKELRNIAWAKRIPECVVE